MSRIPLRARQIWHWQVEQRWIMSRFNSKAILPGDCYENCDYQPMVCITNDYGELTGVSLVNGSVRGCSAFHCGPVKMTLKEARKAAENFEKKEDANV